MKHFLVKSVVIAATAAAALNFAANAEAKVRAFGSTIAPFLSSSATYVDLPIKGTATSLSFNMARKGKVVITFSSECSVDGDATVWAYMQITLNGTPVAPTNNNSTVMCTSDTTIIHDAFVHISKSVVATARAGNNVVKVKARLAFPAGPISFRLEDTSTVVHE